MPVEVIAALCSVGGALAVKGVEVGWRRWKQRKQDTETDEHWHSRVIMEGMKGSQAQQDRAVQILEQLLSETREQAEQCRKEYAALKQSFDEETREVDKLRTQVQRLERKLAERDQQIQELRATLVRDYVRQPSTPAPAPTEDGSGDNTPVIGRGRNGQQ